MQRLQLFVLLALAFVYGEEEEAHLICHSNYKQGGGVLGFNDVKRCEPVSTGNYNFCYIRVLKKKNETEKEKAIYGYTDNQYGCANPNRNDIYMQKLKGWANNATVEGAVSELVFPEEMEEGAKKRELVLAVDKACIEARHGKRWCSPVIQPHPTDPAHNVPDQFCCYGYNTWVSDTVHPYDQLPHYPNFTDIPPQPVPGFAPITTTQVPTTTTTEAPSQPGEQTVEVIVSANPAEPELKADDKAKPSKSGAPTLFLPPLFFIPLLH